MTVPAGSVVVGVDATHTSDLALAWAAEQAVLEHLPLTLVHALGPTYAEEALLDPGGARSALRAQGAQMMARARARVTASAPDLELHELLEVRDPVTLLRDLSHEAAMVVLGSRGRGPVRSAVLGSVGGALARSAACPVVIHRPSHVGLVRQGVLVAADATAESLPVLELAYRQADLRRLPLTVVHCYWELEAVTELQADGPSAVIGEDDARRQLSESMAGLGERFPGVAETTTLVHGPPERHLPTLSARSDLVVVGSHHWPRAHRVMFPSVSATVLEHATCPVAVVPVARPAATGTTRSSGSATSAAPR